MLILIQLGLTIMQTVLGALVKSRAPAEIIQQMQDIIAAITKVHATIVTKAQVDSLFATPTWPDA